MIQTLLFLVACSFFLLLWCQLTDDEVKHLVMEQDALRLEALVRAAKADCIQNETIDYPAGQVICTRTEKGFTMRAILANGNQIKAVVTDD